MLHSKRGRAFQLTNPRFQTSRRGHGGGEASPPRDTVASLYKLYHSIPATDRPARADVLLRMLAQEWAVDPRRRPVASYLGGMQRWRQWHEAWWRIITNPVPGSVAHNCTVRSPIYHWLCTCFRRAAPDPFVCHILWVMAWVSDPNPDARLSLVWGARVTATGMPVFWAVDVALVNKCRNPMEAWGLYLGVYTPTAEARASIIHRVSMWSAVLHSHYTTTTFDAVLWPTRLSNCAACENKLAALVCADCRRHNDEHTAGAVRNIDQLHPCPFRKEPWCKIAAGQGTVYDKTWVSNVNHRSRPRSPYANLHVAVDASLRSAGYSPGHRAWATGVVQELESRSSTWQGLLMATLGRTADVPNATETPRLLRMSTRDRRTFAHTVSQGLLHGECTISHDDVIMDAARMFMYMTSFETDVHVVQHCGIFWLHAWGLFNPTYDAPLLAYVFL